MMAMMGITVALHAIISGATFAFAFLTQLVRLSLLIATCVWGFLVAQLVWIDKVRSVCTCLVGAA